MVESGASRGREVGCQPIARCFCPIAVTLSSNDSMLLAMSLGAAAVLFQAPSLSHAPETATATALQTRQAPNIDGRNDDEVWREAPKMSGFRQFQPHVGALAGAPVHPLVGAFIRAVARATR